MIKKFLKWVPLISLIVSGFGMQYAQGLRIEHRLTVLETKFDDLYNRRASSRLRVIEAEDRAAKRAMLRKQLFANSERCAELTDRALSSH